MENYLSRERQFYETTITDTATVEYEGAVSDLPYRKVKRWRGLPKMMMWWKYRAWSRHARPRKTWSTVETFLKKYQRMAQAPKRRVQ